MRTKRVDEVSEITISNPVGYQQTYNDCPVCGRTWETIPAIPGIVHRTILCIECAKANNEKHFKKR